MQECNEFQFCPQLQQLLEIQKVTGETRELSNHLGIISTKNNLWALRLLLLELKPQNTLEIGLAFGASSLVIASTHQDLKHLPSYQHIAIDPYQSTTWDNAGKIILEKAGLQEYVDIREDFSSSVLPQLIIEDKTFDLIYIDGSHIFENVFIDFYYSNLLLSQQGLLLFDDSYDPHIQKVINFIDKNFSQTYEKINSFYLRLNQSGFEKVKHTLAVKLKKNQLTIYRKIGETERAWDSKFKDF
jgi:predicted O-methyltransferase YrrM